MKTTQQWLAEVKASPDKLTHWLSRQYIGESLAAHRIEELREGVRDTRFGAVLSRIADDESKHAEWIAELLAARGIDLPSPTYDGTRYWTPILDNIHTFEEITGAGYHAEAMRLIRIEALSADEEIDRDIREVFLKILPDERFHAAAFAAMSGPDGIAAAEANHALGLEMLGLSI